MSKSNRKVIQIAVATDGQPDTDSVVIALCDDGTIWQRWVSRPKWHQLDLPPPKKSGLNNTGALLAAVQKGTQP